MFPFDEVYEEVRAQYERFKELCGKEPGYFHIHSLPHETYIEAIRKLANEVNVPFSVDVIEKYDIAMWLKDAPGSMSKKFDAEGQIAYDPYENIRRNNDYLLSHEYAMVGGHAGYVDADLMKMSSLSLERFKDAEMLMSDYLRNWVRDNDVELITYDNLGK